jgi:hypothetical protein
MPVPEKTNQTLIITHALLIGITPLIPVPFVDDLAKSYFQRRLFRQLAQAQGQTFSPKIVSILADDRGGCLSGCLSTVFLYPIKKVLRKIVFILEWQRAISLVTHSYYHGYLLDVTLKEGWLQTDDEDVAARVRAAVDRAHHRANTRLLRDVVKRTIIKSRSMLKDAARRITSGIRLKGKKAIDEEMLEQEEPQAEAAMKEVTRQLQAGIAELPLDHFENLAERLKAEYSRLPR